MVARRPLSLSDFRLTAFRGAERPPERPPSSDRRRVLFTVLWRIGQLMVLTGLVSLAYFGYQNFGTNLVTQREQRALTRELKAAPTARAGSLVAAPPQAPPPPGGALGVIKIPKLGIDRVIVEGVDLEYLKKGPGRYPGTALPGQVGNMAIAGHRTTYGAPFYRLNELVAGDEIIIEYGGAVFTYRVTENKIVQPTDLSVLNPTADRRLTLTTCNPRFSAKERLIIVATLGGGPAGGPANASAYPAQGNSPAAQILPDLSG